MQRVRSMLTRHALWALTTSAACGAASDGRGGPPAPAGPTGPTAPVRPSSGPPEPTRAAPAPYEVHEWGLLRAGPGDTLDAGAVAPPLRAVMPASVDKPILYFHARAPVALASVRVEAVGGALREHWPLTTDAAFPAAVTWRDLALDPAHVVGGAGCAVPRFPSPEEHPCVDLARGEACESAQLANLAAADANCLASPSEAKGATSPFLFYRSRSSTFTPPLRITRLASGEVRVANEGDRPIPGSLVRLRLSNGYVQSRAVRPPAPHASIVISADFSASADDESDDRRADRPAPPGGPDAGRQALRATLKEVGLTGPEVEAFMRAWDPALFGGGEVMDGTAVDVLDSKSDKSAPAVESLLYLLPPEACDGVARLTFDPPPTEVRRALAVWTRF